MPRTRSASLVPRQASTAALARGATRKPSISTGSGIRLVRATTTNPADPRRRVAGISTLTALTDRGPARAARAAGTGSIRCGAGSTHRIRCRRSAAIPETIAPGPAYNSAAHSRSISPEVLSHRVRSAHTPLSTTVHGPPGRVRCTIVDGGTPSPTSWTRVASPAWAANSPATEASA